ncbi:uncharacterized protein PHALS_04431 [Plasmopara halstedii]|uniref:Uncharacterized protein n=1 Tax=Plasmopara halstedii TaxID=4781 RepID=A0A0N7L7N4_PLAHL|nr:uncharacterized protein PHALS_04431 [Plasmopara halstedii]CEG47563.1 hypothetical protein PHALS_04431 [Plasmopara halstedii]|eukprot:XP_024583932.1 hypothetical protein PHALS_04431 [Plasmopara halstedii]
MEFQECMSLLASRPAHAHEQCETQQPTEHQLNVAKSNDNDNFENHTDLTLLSNQELIGTFRLLQEARVQIYADFRQGFHEYQRTEHFSTFCSRITKRFSSVSEQINKIEKLLRDDKQLITAANYIRKIQLEEKEKLLVTSALLIEKMRLSNAIKRVELDEPEVAFLERSIKTLNAKHNDCIVRINDILDDLSAECAELDC